jgi:tetratricopeptide (TPR) repeat protein
VAETPGDEQGSALLDRPAGPVFRRGDWLAFWTTFLITLGVYAYTLAPTVTLEDSGELAVASDYLGVPHPPGYPIWSLVTWFFQLVFHWVKYYGQPNPAWSVGLSSAVFGALASALLALLVSRSGADILRSMKRTSEVLGFATENLLGWAAGVAGGLLFAFSPVLWSQSVIVEVYALNAFFLVIILVFTYAWMCRPEENRLLYITAFLFGLGLTNHQSLLFIALGMLAAIWFRDRALFRDSLAGLFLCIAVYLFWKVRGMGAGPLPPEALRAKHTTLSVGLLFLLSPVGLFLIERKLMTEWKRVLIIAALVLLGLSFNAYLPFSSEQNPPINWGYPRTPEGFMHALTRGQYEKIDPTANFKHAVSHPGHFLALLNAIIFDPRDYTSVVAQFTWPLALLTLVPPFFFFSVSRRARNWITATFILFFSLTVIFIIFQYPQLDVQTLFIGRVQYIQAHAIFALWISYGLMFLLAFLETLLGGGRVAKYGGLCAAFLLPLAPILRNAYDQTYIKLVGGVEQNGHDFGWQFGNYQLRGAAAIREELKPGEPPLPNPDYPPPMETNAIFYGGTDPGRFVPTYMIYCAKVRPDVYLITQNALADNTYMNVMRDLYGDTIWIPAQQDSNYAFQKYVEDVQAGRIPAGADVQFQGGRVSVQGVQGVMMINGILAKMIFDNNRERHAFYVEESYVIPWMYPYLEPHGLIMKIHRDPIPAVTPEMLKNDRDFWNWYTRRLMNNPKFLRDVVARKTFSKLRSAIAGIYAFRRLFSEAEYAFRQSIELYPLSPEANFRLADVFMQQRRFSEARQLIEEFLRQDPGNDKVNDFLNQIRNTEQTEKRRLELEQAFAKGPADLNSALELSDIYRRMGMMQQFEALTMSILNNAGLPPDTCLGIAKMYADAGRPDLVITALRKYVEREPGNPSVWIDLAAIHATLQQAPEAVQALSRAVELGGESARDVARKDRRFDPIRENAEFKRLVPSMQATLPGGLPNLPMF